MYAARARVSPHRPTLPFKYRRKSFSDDDDVEPSDYLVPPSPSLSPSRSLSMSSSPPSSPSALQTSPIRPSHLATVRLHAPSSPTRPSAYHAYGYSHTISTASSAYDYDLTSGEHLHLPKRSPSRSSRAYAIIPTPSATSSARSSFSLSSPTRSDALSAVFSSPTTNTRT